MSSLNATPSTLQKNLLPSIGSRTVASTSGWGSVGNMKSLLPCRCPSRTAALARVAELGQGWYGLGLNPEDLPPLLSRLDELLARHGRGRADIEIAVSPYLRGCDLAKLERYREEGVDQVILPGLAPNTESIRPTLESLASKLLEAEDRV